jgi:hypothetical protein
MRPAPGSSPDRFTGPLNFRAHRRVDRRDGRPRSLRCERLMRLLNPQSLARHTDRLRRAAWALCGSRRDAEDLVQETFTRVLEDVRVLDWDATRRSKSGSSMPRSPGCPGATAAPWSRSGLSYAETGRSLGVREATVATRVFRVRRLRAGRRAEEERPRTEPPPSGPRVRTRESPLAATMGERAA